MSKYIIFLGAAGSGKGTQAQKIKSTQNIIHLSTGDLLRNAMKNETSLGLEAKSFVDSGNLVPDKLIIDLVRSQLLATNAIKKGFILDGFPRTLTQAQALDTMLDELSINLSNVVLFDVSLEDTIHRIVGRRVCSHCQHVYHIDSIGSNTNCSNCGSQNTLIHRADDTEDKVRHRYDVFLSQTEPLIDYYKRLSGLLYSLDATKSSDSIYDELTLSVFN